jgi:hypothetical protein
MYKYNMFTYYMQIYFFNQIWIGEKGYPEQWLIDLVCEMHVNRNSQDEYSSGIRGVGIYFLSYGLSQLPLRRIYAYC